MNVLVYPGENGVAQGVAEFWGGNLTETSFATSYIPNAGATNTQVTRTADDMTMDPHPANTNEWVLPEEFCATCAASKITIYYEAKCQWSGSADIGGVSRELLSISPVAGAPRISSYVDDVGRLRFIFYDSGAAFNWVRSGADPVDYSEWFSARCVMDYADMSRMDMWIAQPPPPDGVESDAGMGFSGNVGTETFDTSNTLIRVGQEYDGTVSGYCNVRNLRIVPAEVRP